MRVAAVGSETRMGWVREKRDGVRVSLPMDTLPSIIPDTILANQHKVRSGQELVRPVRAGAVRCVCRGAHWKEKSGRPQPVKLGSK